MTQAYQFVLDQSTSGTKLLVLKDGIIYKRYDKAHQQIYPQIGWVEHDPLEIWQNVQQLLSQALAEADLDNTVIQGLSLTNQRETIVAWDKETGQPLYNAIVWQCNRSVGICEAIVQQGKEALIIEKTGLRLDPYFSGTKIKWLVDNVPAVRQKSGTGELAIGTIDSWLLWNLTQQQVFATEASNACRTLLFNINDLIWDPELIDLFGIHAIDLPELKNSDAVFGNYQGIPIKGVMADSQAALLGEGCLAFGDVKITMGTGCSVMMQIENTSNLRDRRILSTVAWQLKDSLSYGLEGIIKSCGDSINWFIETFANNKELRHVCDTVLEDQTAETVYFIPALQGLAAPEWNNQVTASFIGMKRTTTQADCLRAILESIIFQVKAVVDVMESVTGYEIQRVHVDGGVIKNQALMKLMATLLGKPIILNDVEELSGLGVATLLYPLNQQTVPAHRVISPAEEQYEIKQRYEKWNRLIKKAQLEQL